jgi:hypothetical protein
MYSNTDTSHDQIFLGRRNSTKKVINFFVYLDLLIFIGQKKMKENEEIKNLKE